MALKDDWAELLAGGVAPADQPPILAAGAEALNTFLHTHPSARDDLTAIVSRRLPGPGGQETWVPIEQALMSYLGPDLSPLITWLVIDENQLDRLSQLEPDASSEAMELLRWLIALFGYELERALARLQEFPDNWRTVFREVNFDQVSSRTSIKLRVLKFNDEWATIEGTPDSMLDFARNLLLALAAVPPTYQFRPLVATAFLDDVAPVIQALEQQTNAPPAGADGAGAPDVSEAPGDLF